MLKIAMLSGTPLGLPASCWATGCGCGWICSALTPLACVTASMAVAVTLFSVLSLIYELHAIQSLRD